MMNIFRSRIMLRCFGIWYVMMMLIVFMGKLKDMEQENMNICQICCSFEDLIGVVLVFFCFYVRDGWIVEVGLFQQLVFVCYILLFFCCRRRFDSSINRIGVLFLRYQNFYIIIDLVYKELDKMVFYFVVYILVFVVDVIVVVFMVRVLELVIVFCVYIGEYFD